MKKKIDLSTQEGLDTLKVKARDYGHYAEFLQVAELIEEVEALRKNVKDIRDAWERYYYFDVHYDSDYEVEGQLEDILKEKIQGNEENVVTDMPPPDML